jgi:PAS domain S-box-containing protein
MKKHSGKPRVLLVDDEAIIALAQKSALEERGYEVTIAASGEAAIKAAAEDPGLGIVLMDIDLGKGIDGTEAARRLLAIRDIPVIFLSSHTNDETIERTERISSYGYVVKDSGIAVLEASIKMARRLFEARAEEKARRKALEELEARQRATLRSIGDGVISCDSRGKVTALNLVAEELTGWAAEDAIGRDVEDVFDISNALTGEKARNPVSRALAEGLVVGLANHTCLKSRSGESRQIADSCAPIRDAEGRVFGAVLVFRDVSDEYARNEALRASEAALQRRNELLSTLLDNLSVGVFMVEAPSGRPLIANEAAKRFLGRGIMPDARRESLAEVYAARKLGEEGLYPTEEMPIVRALRGESSCVDDMAVTRPDGTETILEVCGSPIRDEEGKVWAGIVSFMDITERRESERAIRDARRRLEAILRGTNAGTWEWNVKTGECSFNERWAEIVGYSLEELKPLSIETWIRLTHPEDRKLSEEALKRHFSGLSDYYEAECRMRHKDGRWVWVLDRGAVDERDGNGAPLMMYGTHQDITARKEAEESIRALLAEKELILKEVHHRVKNNMATILSLLELQASALMDDAAKAALKDAANRVMGMSILYDKLYRSKDFSGMPVGEYLESLVGELVSQFPEGPGVRVEAGFDELRLDAKVLVPLGIIVNELVTNAMKYAFRGREGGRLAIEARRAGGGMELTIQDDGPGFDPDGASGEGFGLIMARALCEQIGATLELSASGGARATIRLAIGEQA